MTLDEIKIEIRKYLYLEDDLMIDVILATVIGNLTQPDGEPIWMTIIGAPSGGKTQLILPIEEAQPKGKKILHRITDLTPNTFLSGAIRKNEDGSILETSLLKRIGDNGILLFPDLTSLFSKEPHELQEILGTLRHIYDGALTKMTGNGNPIEWSGKIGVIGASTADLYRHLERYSSMGERLIYYRMMPTKNRELATEKALSRDISSKELSSKIAELYSNFIKETISKNAGKKHIVSLETRERIKKASMHASLLRTNVYVSYRNDGARIERIPEPEMPMRTSIQLLNLAKGFMAMNGGDELTKNQIQAIEWCAWSLAGDEKRKTLMILANHEDPLSTGDVGSLLGLETDVARGYLLQLSATGIVERNKDSGNADKWKIIHQELKEFVLRIGGKLDTRTEISENSVDDFENF